MPSAVNRQARKQHDRYGPAGQPLGQPLWCFFSRNMPYSESVKAHDSAVH
jgi:hypothetical protein